MATAGRDDEDMRRHLLLVRHAKSAWDDTSLTDHDRPLAPRGTKALRRIRDHVLGADHRPELVLCSSSRRTVETLGGIRPAIPEQARVEVERELYLASAGTLLARLRALGSGVECAMVIGHNPGTQDLAMLLVGDGDAEMRAQLVTKLPTGAVVTLSFDGAWADLGGGVARIDDLFMPRPTRS